MLKKPAAIMLMLLYLVTATGFALNLHYCFGELASIKIDAPAKTCSKGLLASKGKCCRDKHFEIKVKDSHEPGTKSSVSKIFNEELLFILTTNVNFGIQARHTSELSYHGPPGNSDNGPIYLTNHNFRI
ncbi:MAG: hypothetical protein JST32_07225 [Bacteroidetes bacterium]|nr:hypothetical protein [Bacteroidota bacterium]